MWARVRGELLREAGRQVGVSVVDAPQMPDEAYRDPVSSGLVDRLRFALKLGLPGIDVALKAFAVHGAGSWDRLRRGVKLESVPRSWHPFFAMSARRAELITDPNSAEHYHGTYLWTTLELMPVFAPRGPTAVIAARDQLAQTFVRWFVRAHVDIPSRMSIISFDNEFLADSLCLTSVDFGFEELGYQAFHALLGDVPTRRTRDGNIAARPYVVDRGSVGKRDGVALML
jgi:hypothetical protein